MGNKNKNTEEDIAPVLNTDETERKWYDGFFQIGDAITEVSKSKSATINDYVSAVAKTILGTNTDILTNSISGVVGWGEDVIDAGASLVGMLTESFGWENATNNIRNFVEGDLYDDQEVSRQLLKNGAPFGVLNPTMGGLSQAISAMYTVEEWLNPQKQENSLLGDTSRGIIQSTGETLAKQGIQAAAGGIPVGDIITGITVFGAQSEQALRENATFMQAGGSGLISAAAEIMFEKLSGGIKISGRTLDEGLTKLMSRSISNVALRNFFSFVKDVGGEAIEEAATEFVGKLGTLLYKDRDEWDEILFSKDALVDYIQSAISGGLMGGAFNAADAVNSSKKGVDYKSGLTNDEQKVVDKVTEKLVKEKEANGEKLSAKEKNLLYESVLKQLEEGDIDISDIEDALGEEVFKEYSDTIKYEDDILKQYEELGKKKNPTLAEMSMYDELKSQYNDIKENSQREELKKQMSDKVFERVKDTKLMNSYVDVARRGETFQADINEYDEAERATIQSAIDAGFLNNTNKTRRFVNWVAKIAAKMNIKVDFTTIEKLKESGFAVDGKFVNGYKTKDGIGLNMQSNKLMETVVGHEITHVLEGTKELYDAMKKTLFEYAESKGELETRRKAIKELYKGMKADIDSELTAELVGDYLFTDQEFINRLANDNRTIFQKIWDEVKYMWKQAHPSSPEAQKLEKLKRAFEEAYKHSGGVKSNDTKYSLSDSKQPTLDDLIKKDPIPVIDIKTDMESGTYTEMKAAALEKATNEGWFDHPHPNDDTDSLIFITKDSFTHAFSNLTKDFGEDTIRCMAHIPQIIKNSILTDISAPKDPNKTETRVYTFFGAVDGINGVEPVKLTVKEFDFRSLKSIPKNVRTYFENNGIMETYDTLYDAKALEVVGIESIKKESDASGSVGEIGTLAKSTSDSTISVADLLALVKGDAEKYLPKSQKNAENDISVLEGGSVTKFSLSTWTPETQNRVKNDLVKSGFDSAQVDKWIADTNSVAAVIAADKDRLDFEATDNQVMLKDNQEYIKTLDASTLCAKRLVYQGTFDAIQHRLPNTVLTSDDLIDLLNMMKEKGVQTPCGVCYVESRRRHLGKFAKEWLDGYKGEYKPNLDDVTTSDGLEALRKSHPQTYKDFVDAMNKKGSSNPKVVQLRTEYRNEIMSLTPAQIRKIEAIGGLRVQSFSDFETPHMLDMMQAVMDMSAKGLHSQAYTKVPNFAWVFGDTGIKINLSLIAEGDGFDADGNLAFSSTEGMSIDDAMALRDAYSSNVGTIIVGANDKHILACMADDRIDFIIPFHRSGWGKNELDMMGMSSYTDYTYGQKEHDLATGKGVANLYPPDYWDYSVSGKQNAEKYLSLCAKLGREPKFSQFLVNNGDGSYSLQPDGSTDGYWKTLIDFKMYDNNGVGAAQQTVQPNFNMTEAYRVLNEYEGGANKLPVANEVVDEFVAKKQGVQFSLSEDTTEATPRDVYFSRIDEVYDKLKGKSAGKSHMVDGYNFFLQRNDFDESAYISITTPKGEKLRQIVDGGNLWKNARLWREAAKMVANNEHPNVATATTQEEAGEYSEIEGKREETKKTFKEKVSDAKTLGKKAVGYLVDKYQPFEELALKTGNRELEAKANSLRTAGRAAQHYIGHGADGVRAINDIRQEAEASGLEREFNEYIYDWLTVDRMSLEDKARPVIKKLGDKFKKLRVSQLEAIAKKEITQKTSEKEAQTIRDAKEYLRAIRTRNKPVRGDFYTADIARAHATELEQKYPQFKQWAEDVYANTNFMLDKLVADGELSQEAADRFRELYPHYVPIRRVNKEGKAIDVPLYSNRTGIDAPIKGATGGDGTIGYLFETLAMRAEQTFLAGAKNRLGIELKNTLKAKTTDAEVDVEDIFDEVDTHEDRLKAGEDGQAPTFTVFENGKRVTFEIPEDIYEALKPTPEALKGTIPVLSAITKFQRGVLTEYNPFFMARNAVKDFQDVLINSQHALETYKNFPEAMKQLYSYAKGGEDAQYAKEYFENGAEELTYFDGKEKLFDSKNTENPWAKEKDSEAKRILGFIPSKISQASSFVERVPRLAEYIASRKAGASIDVAMLDAARVTTNFAAGGDVTKWANRNGATFLNASVQGAAQAVRNVREAKAQGLQGMLKLGAKVAIAGIPYLILNALLWGDDEEYEELSDYIKENYYIVAKFGDGQFVRIPKGRMAAVIQSAFQQMSNLVTGDDEVDFKRFGELMWENIAPNNPLENNIFAPIMNVADNKTWYGDDLVPQRLQDLPAGEQSDETTDLISKWLGETLNVSPYKLNYLLDQYSGVFGDMFLPSITPQAEGGNTSLLGGMIAPLTDQFTTDSVMKNQNVSDFYDTLDDLTASAKSKYATDADVLRYRYMNTINSELSNLYKQKREAQNSNLSNEKKYQAVREIQRQIDLLAEQALNSYDSVKIYGNTATVGGITYKKNSKGEWQKVSSSSSSSNKIWSDTTVDKFIQDFDLPKVNWD